MASFSKWFASVLGQSQIEVERLLRHPSATHFLVAWSLYESKCFGGYVKPSKFDDYVVRCISEGFNIGQLNAHTEHFHTRYQNADRFKSLMHKQSSSRLNQILIQPASTLSSEDRLFLLVFVAYRFRNNIFHGNKGVDSWLRFSEQIDLCTEALQAFVSHAELKRCSLRSENAA